MLPIATQDGEGADFMDSLFTATSAVCVTGLILHDTATYWSSFGQAVTGLPHIGNDIYVDIGCHVSQLFQKF